MEELYGRGSFTAPAPEDRLPLKGGPTRGSRGGREDPRSRAAMVRTPFRVSTRVSRLL